MDPTIGKKIQLLRKKRRITQKELANALGWKNHQTVTDLENGQREIKAWELNEIAKYLHVSLQSLFSDENDVESPLVLWREKPISTEELYRARFIERCKNYSWINKVVTDQANPVNTLIETTLPFHRIDLNSFTLDNAEQLSNQIRKLLSLGDFPASQLISVLEDNFNVRFIVDTAMNQSSAACSRFGNESFILINAHDAPIRQYFSVAHELFHLLSWGEELLFLVEKSETCHKKMKNLQMPLQSAY